jgi:tetratricopeptide (TPR) repeat protein
MGTVPKGAWGALPVLLAGLALLLGGSLPAAGADAQGAAPLATVSLAGVPEDARPILTEARRLLVSGDAAGAWQLLAAREADWAGSPVYDYLLGIAALDSGRAPDAIFSLSRVVAAEPGFDGARMELARALFEANDLEGARTQFAYLAGRSPPPETAAVIARYQAAIDQRSGQSGNAFSAFVEAGGGYDSNANASTSDGQFLGFDLNNNNVETDSVFATLAAGVLHQAGLGNGWSVASNLRGDWRKNPDARFVDQAIASASTALLWNRGPWRASAGVNGYYGWLDGSPQEAYVGAALGIGRMLGDRWELAAGAQGGPVRFQRDVLEVLDVDRYLGALTLTRYGLGAGGRVALSVLGGRDDATRTGSPYSNDRVGARIATRWPVGRASGAYVEAGWLQSEYDQSPGFFGGSFGRRKDDQLMALAGFELGDWPAKDWVLSPRLRYVDNESTIPLYEYDRWEAAVTLRRAFR